VESALSIHVKNAKVIVAILRLNHLSIALDFWEVIINVTNLIVISLKLKRRMEVCSFIFYRFCDSSQFNIFRIGSVLRLKKIWVSTHGLYDFGSGQGLFLKIED